MKRGNPTGGFSLTEMVVAIAIIGLLASGLLFGRILLSPQTTNQTAVSSAKETLQQSVGVAETDIGYFPIDMGSAKIVKSRLNAGHIRPISAGAHRACPTEVNGMPVFNDDDSEAELQGGALLLGLSQTWRGTNRDLVCIVPRGKSEDEGAGEIVALTRSGRVLSGDAITQPDPGEDGNENLVADNANPAEEEDAGGMPTGNPSPTNMPTITPMPGKLTVIVENMDGTRVKDADVTLSGDSSATAKTDAQGIALFQVTDGDHLTIHATKTNYTEDQKEIVISGAAVETLHIMPRIAGFSRRFNEAMNDSWLVNKDKWGGYFANWGHLVNNVTKAYQHDNSISRADDLQAFLGENINQLRRFTWFHGGQVVYLTDPEGNVNTISFQNYRARLKINGLSFSEWRKTFIAQYPQFKNNNDWNVLSQGTRLLDLDITYTHPGDAKKGIPPCTSRVDVNFFWQSPVKISLKGKDAKLDSSHGFKMDPDGFNDETRNPYQTQGGLNEDEAWLVDDRSHNDVLRNGIVDGEDVFGDHLGRFPSGYEDLAARYEGYIRKDKKGRAYIPLHQLACWERLWLWLMQVFNVKQAANPSVDLKLLTTDNKLHPASDVLRRVYVDYWLVYEMDAAQMNCIRQRAYVQYANGHYAQSADQWFRPLVIFQNKPLKPAK